MSISRIRALATALLVAACIAAPAALGADYPTKPIHLVVTVAPGGGTDAVGRVTAARLSAALGQAVVVENRAGAGGQIGSDYVAKAAPDGYTLLLMGSSLPMLEAVARASDRKLPFDTIRDFTPVAQLVNSPFVLAVDASLPYRTAAEYVAAARAKPGSITYASSGVGRTDHIAGAMFASMLGIDLLHVPFNGLGPGITAILGHEVQSVFGALPAVASQIRAGQLRPLGAIGSARIAQMPDLPTLAEAVPLPGYAVDSWIGVVAPAGTSDAVVDRLSRELASIVKDPRFATESLQPLGVEPVGGTPRELGQLLRSELDKYTPLFKKTGITFE